MSQYADPLAERGRGPRQPWSSAIAGPRPLLGTFIQFPSAPLIEIIGRTGFDFIILDLEHAEFGLTELPEMQRAAELAGLYTVVRVPPREPVYIGKALDYGANAVLVPHIDSASDAAEAVRAAKYPPSGRRGVYPVMRGAAYGLDHRPGWEEEANRTTSVILLIESGAGAENLAEIARVPGVSGLFLGPMDLSHSLGIPGETRHPRVEEIARAVQKTTSCKRLVLPAPSPAGAPEPPDELGPPGSASNPGSPTGKVRLAPGAGRRPGGRPG